MKRKSKKQLKLENVLMSNYLDAISLYVDTTLCDFERRDKDILKLTFEDIESVCKLHKKLLYGELES